MNLFNSSKCSQLDFLLKCIFSCPSFMAFALNNFLLMILSAEGLKEVCERYKKAYRKHVGEEFPQDPTKQLTLAVEAVFKSWNTSRAKSYRQINDITGLTGTAVNVQAMVFGNMGSDCATGVAFTRNPSTGENSFFGERHFLLFFF